MIQTRWRQGMTGSVNAHDAGIKAFSGTYQTEDVRVITVPTRVLHGEDDKVVPVASSALTSIALRQNGTHRSGQRGLRTDP